MDNTYMANQIGLALLLFVTALVGQRAGRNMKTMREYALANQSLGME